MQSREYSVIVLYDYVLATPLLGDGGFGGGVEWGERGRGGKDRRCRLQREESCHLYFLQIIQSMHEIALYPVRH
jgi:hypothetical protein